MNRCDQTCKYPCARDHRTKAEKIAAMRAGATTDGERAAADAAAAKHPLPPPPRQAGKEQWTQGHDTASASSFGTSQTFYTRWTTSTGTGAKARPGFWDNSEAAEFIRAQQREYESAIEREILRRSEEALREAIQKGKIRHTTGFEEE